MGTITEKMSYLKETKQAIRTAIEEKGVSVADTDTFRSYASKIGTISVGGGGTKWYVGDFYDGQMYEGNNGDLFLNTGTTDQGTIFQFYDGMWSPVGNLMGPQGAQGLSGASEPVGSIILWGGDSVPANYLPCVGSAVSRTEYSDLFSVIGTQFGEGDGSTTFNLPDFSGLAPVGIDDSDTNFNAVGKTYGEKTHTLTKAETPSLTGSIQTRQQNDNNTIDIYPTESTAESVFTYTKNGGDRWNNMGSGWATSNSNNARIDFDNGGEDEPHNNIQPSIAMKFYIKAYQATATPAQVVDSLDGNSTTDAPSVHAVNNKINSLVEDNIVYVNTLETTTESFSVDGLDIVSDGEHYEITLEAFADEETEVYIRFNNYTGTDYYSGYIYMEETTGGTGQSAIAATMNAYTYIGDRLKMDTGNIPSIMKMDIYYTPKKSGSGGYASYIINYVSSGRKMVYLGGNLLEGVDNINSIQFFTPHGNFVPKTRVTVRKVR